LDLYGELLACAPQLRLQASGGIRDIADIRAATALGCDGVVLGKALLDAKFALSDALETQLQDVASC
jgi:phosphoribosylformimino-5-aminoimidazole carboxamide ribotide isomerase